MKSLFWLLLSVHLAFGADYAIVVSQKTAENKNWARVVSALQEKHSAEIVHYKDSVEEALPSLRASFPRYACFVATPNETTKDLVRPFTFLPGNWTMILIPTCFGEYFQDMMRKMLLPLQRLQNLWLLEIHWHARR